MFSFDCFYQLWLFCLRALIKPLISSPPKDDEASTQVVDRMLDHYHDYYNIKTHYIKLDLFNILGSSWATSLEHSMHWIGGWRPITLLHLIHTESTANFEAKLIDLLRGKRTGGDLADLSSDQVKKLSELQIQTVKEEDVISAAMGRWQESCWEGLVLLNCCDDDSMRKDGLVVIVEKAEELRYKTMRSVMKILSPKQGVELWIVMAELLFGVRWCGQTKDQKRCVTDGCPEILAGLVCLHHGKINLSS